MFTLLLLIDKHVWGNYFVLFLKVLFIFRDKILQTVNPTYTTRKYPFPPHKPEDDIDYDDDEDRDDDPDDDDDDDFSNGLLTTSSNVGTEPTSSFPPVIETTTTAHKSKFLEALTVNNPSETETSNVPETVEIDEDVSVSPRRKPKIPSAPPLPIPDPAVGAVKEQLEEENIMNMDNVPTVPSINNTLDYFNDKDDLTE